MGTPELLVLLGIPLMIILPVWLSFKTYKNDLRLWRQLSCIGSLLGSWIGYVVVRCAYQACAGYQQERLSRAKRDSNA